VVILCCATAIVASAVGTWALRKERVTIANAKIEKGKRRDYWIGNGFDME